MTTQMEKARSVAKHHMSFLTLDGWGTEETRRDYVKKSMIERAEKEEAIAAKTKGAERKAERMAYAEAARIVAEEI